MVPKSLEICQIPPSKCQPIVNLECKDRFFLIVCDQLVPKVCRNTMGMVRNAREAFRQVTSSGRIWAANWIVLPQDQGTDCKSGLQGLFPLGDSKRAAVA